MAKGWMYGWCSPAGQPVSHVACGYWPINIRAALYYVCACSQLRHEDVFLQRTFLDSAGKREKCYLSLESMLLRKNSDDRPSCHCLCLLASRVFSPFQNHGPERKAGHCQRTNSDSGKCETRACFPKSYEFHGCSDRGKWDWFLD